MQRNSNGLIQSSCFRLAWAIQASSTDCDTLSKQLIFQVHLFIHECACLPKRRKSFQKWMDHYLGCCYFPHLNSPNCCCQSNYTLKQRGWYSWVWLTSALEMVSFEALQNNGTIESGMWHQVSCLPCQCFISLPIQAKQASNPHFPQRTRSRVWKRKKKLLSSSAKFITAAQRALNVCL